MKMVAQLLFFLLFTLTVHTQENGTTIEVKIERISSDDGQLLIGLYDSEENWLKTRKMSVFARIANGTSEVVFEKVPEGTYAISLFHDENNNGEMDTNFMGIPKEDTGSSNNAPAKFGPPKWEDAKFLVKGNTVKQIIKL